MTTAEALVAAINEVRFDHGLPTLVWDDRLGGIAGRWAGAMASGMPYAARRDNRLISCGLQDPEMTVEVWMDQATNRDILLGDFDSIGVGYAQGQTPSGPDCYWCADFAKVKA